MIKKILEMYDIPESPFSPEASEYESGITIPGSKGSEWEAWIKDVEKLFGHTLDGDEDPDGYSLDSGYEAWEKGITPEEYVVERPNTKAPSYLGD